MIFVCYSKCSTCNKAKKYLDSKKIKYTYREIKQDKLSYDELKKVAKLSQLPINKLFNLFFFFIAFYMRERCYRIIHKKFPLVSNSICAIFRIFHNVL